MVRKLSTTFGFERTDRDSGRREADRPRDECADWRGMDRRWAVQYGMAVERHVECCTRIRGSRPIRLATMQIARSCAHERRNVHVGSNVATCPAQLSEGYVAMLQQGVG